MFVLFLNGSKLKKTFPFCLQKTTTSFFTCLTRFFFFVFVRKKQVCLLLGFIAVPKKLAHAKKGIDSADSRQKTCFLFYFFFIFKTKQTFILILHLPMKKPRKKKGKNCFVFLPKKGRTKMTSKYLKRGYYLNKTSNFTSSVASTKMISGGSWVLIQSWIRFDDLQKQLILIETFFIFQKETNLLKLPKIL